jgi:predicted ferric reductase
MEHVGVVAKGPDFDGVAALAFVTMILVGVYLVLHSRLVRPLLARRRPYRIVEVRRQRAQATTLVLEPESSAPLLFRPGRFILLTIGDSPLSMQQHPFSLASSALDRRVELTAKGSGDFTVGLTRVTTGMRSWLESPYGAFTLDLDKACGAVFIAGGVGITPFMSMLRTYRDRGSKFPLVLLYCSSSWDEVIFRDEHEALQAQMQLTLVHVLQQAPEGWHGESGYLDAAMLDRHLPVDPIGHEYFICGPAPLMDVV